ncbi:MAG: replicative DNA helicase [Patescibacteria group bacterium]
MPDLLKIPPHNKEAETAVLGSLMIDPSAMMRVADILEPDDFYHSEHRLIYATLQELFERAAPLDIVAVSNRLEEKTQLEQAGGASMLAAIVNAVATSSGVEHYATLVKQKRVRRDLIATSHYINELGFQEEREVAPLLDEAEQRIFALSQHSLRQKFLPVKSALHEAWERIENLHKGEGMLRGVPTGFAELDRLLSGLQKSDLVVLAARPSLGKTSLAMDIARNAALQHRVPVGIFSLEMSIQQLVDRFLASTAHVDLWRLRTGKLSPDSDDFVRVHDAISELSEAPIYIDDGASSTVLQMRAMARRLQAEHGLGLVIVDYLQLIRPQTHTESMVQQITEISRSLKALARELDVPVLALSQLSRAIEQRPGHMPRLADLRDSGSIEQDADVVMFIYREDKARADSERPNIADIMVEKHRNGPTGKVELYFNQEKVSFSSIDTHYA